MIKLLKNPTHFLATAVGIWTLLTLVLNFAFPHSWFFVYDSLTAQEVVCRDTNQEVIGVRWALFTTPSEGVDNLYMTNLNNPSDRFPWDQGKYLAGHSTSTWYPTINVQPGEYEWRSDLLRLDILYIFPVYLSENERPKSNTFNVVECN